jgi:transposase
MAGARFSDEEWQRIWTCLKDHPGIYVGQEAPTRLLLDAVLWMAHPGAEWRLLPDDFGPWNSIDKRSISIRQTPFPCAQSGKRRGLPTV